jgi:hypothetical protein
MAKSKIENVPVDMPKNVPRCQKVGKDCKQGPTMILKQNWLVLHCFFNMCAARSLYFLDVNMSSLTQSGSRRRRAGSWTWPVEWMADGWGLGILEEDQTSIAYFIPIDSLAWGLCLIDCQTQCCGS